MLMAKVASGILGSYAIVICYLSIKSPKNNRTIIRRVVSRRPLSGEFEMLPTPVAENKVIRYKRRRCCMKCC